MGKKSERMSKEARQSLKMWADGARETILLPHITPYGDALDRGWNFERDYLEKVCQEYHARVDWRLADHEEPPLPLSPYNPNAIPVTEDLTDEDRQVKIDRIKTLNERIRRWLKYRVKKNRTFTFTRMECRKDPYTVLLARLSGVKAPPKARQAYQQFMHEKYHDEIDGAVKIAWQKKIRHDHLSSGANPNAAFRAKVAREVFNNLPADEQAFWQKKAKDEADAAKAAYEEELKKPAARDLDERQRCIDLIPGFIGPIIQGIQEITKLKFLLVYGGPFPCNGGELSMNHINYGTNLANEPAYFFQHKRENFEKNVMGEWMEWLQTCYTAKDLEEARPLNDNLAEARYSFSDEDDDAHLDGGLDGSTPASTGKEPEASAQKKTKLKGNRPRDTTQPKLSSPASPAPTQPSAVSSSVSQELQPSSSRVSQSAIVVAQGIPLPTGENTPAGPAAPNTQQSSTISPSTVHASPPRAPTLPYSPYNPDDPDGPLRLPDFSKYEQVKAYNIARNKRTLAHIDTQLQPPAKKHKPWYDMAAPRVVQGSSSASSMPQLPTPSITPEELPATPMEIDSPVDTPPSPAASNPSTSSTAPQGSGASSLPSSDGESSDHEARPSPATSTSPSITDPLPICPSAAPKWMHDAVSCVTRQHLGGSFTNLVRGFIAIEAAHGYQNPNRGLPVAGRPDALGKWVGSGRWRGKDPVVSNPDNFGVTWWRWWCSLQPGWRRIENGRPKVITQICLDWECFALPGQNGVLSIVATLFWWGVAVNGTGVPGPAYESWLAAVADVNWVFDGLINYLEIKASLQSS